MSASSSHGALASVAAASSPHAATAALRGVAVAALRLGLLFNSGLHSPAANIFVSRQYHQIGGPLQEVVSLDLALLHGELPRVYHVVVVATLSIDFCTLVAQRDVRDATGWQLRKLLAHCSIEL